MEPSQSPAGEAAPAKRNGMMSIVTIVAALAVGLGVGRQVVGPMLGPGSGEHEESAEEVGEGHGAEAGGPTLLYSIDGVIVNPAGSRGRNHLILTVVYKVAVAADEARLRAVDVVLRDGIASMLERKSIETLTNAGIRDQLRSELAAIAAPYVKGGPVTVYLPQFIVQ